MERARRKVLEGLVTSDKMQKTVVVTVETKNKHPLYRKLVITHKKYHAHNENDDAKLGDRVEITETRPLSATKNWRVSRIIERAR
ncbi:30S ribosomal protein S17 [Ureaplasma diversum]|uniref:Small ribosomal subunit protein uS17 n=2 Tax=Ureaplasma diversum TaxID=42094 RepID=A0A084F1Q8_9BACT|nr:30S ribosomal protein S17 [Ureaplasma diversum]AJQ45606.1 30S ribosomal protein S17 [Ureaplasma diversum]KEZ24150.1 30S ribosomal protein S17 [Ureaplasma diversum NCTC 246]